MNFGLFGRYFGFYGATGEPDDGATSPFLRRIAYGVGGVLLAGLLGLALLVLAGRRPPPQRLPAALRTPAPAIAPAEPSGPAAASRGGDTAADSTDERLSGVRQQIESEAAVVAALRDQVDEARHELADLQRQQAEARRNAPDTRRRPEPATLPAAAKPVAEKPVQAPDKPTAEQRRVAEGRVPDRFLPESAVAPKPQLAESRPAEVEATGRTDPRSTGTPALDRALGRLRSAAAPRAEDGAPPGRSPPPTILGQIPAAMSEADAVQPVAGAAPARVATAAPALAPATAPRRRVFLHYRSGSQPGENEANDLAHRLLFSDFAYAETRTVPASTATPMIRYYHREDADAAGRLADLLRGSGMEFRVQDSSGYPTRTGQGTLEVWIP